MSPSLAPARGGRGNKGMAQKVAERAGISKRSVNRIVKPASAAIGETIDLDHDTPEELERKADKRQHAERKVERPKHSKPAPRVEDPTPPAEAHAADIDSRVEALWKTFDAIGRTYQLRFVYYACIRLGLRPLRMGAPCGIPAGQRRARALLISSRGCAGHRQRRGGYAGRAADAAGS